VLWLSATVQFHYYKQNLTPQQMARTLTDDIQKRERVFENIGIHAPLISKIYDGNLTIHETKNIIRQPFCLYAFYNGKMIFWNNNEVLANQDFSPDDKGKVIYSDEDIYIQRCYHVSEEKNSEKVIMVLIPIATIYPFENEYLRSHFYASDKIPPTTTILPEYSKDAYPINSISGKTLFYVQFPKGDVQAWQPDWLLISLLILGLICTVSWLQLIALHISRNKSYTAGCVFTIVMVVGLRSLLYIYGLPFHLRSLPLFSPELYASSSFLPSLGDLLLNTLCLLWIVLFVLTQLSYKDFLRNKVTGGAKIFITIFSSYVIVYVALRYFKLVRSVVLDSMISFDVSRFYSVSIYAIIGLITIGLITGLAVLFIYTCNATLNIINPKKWIKYPVILAIGSILIFLSIKEHAALFYIMLLWILLFIRLLDVRKLRLDTDLFSPHMIFWGVFICLSTTCLLQYFNYVKEKDTRKVFAKHSVRQKDEAMEYAFRQNIVPDIRADFPIREFFMNASAEKRKQINSYLEAFYLRGALGKYQSEVYLYDKNGKSLYNRDSLDYNSMLQKIEKELPDKDSVLFYNERAQDGHYYVGRIPIVDMMGGNELVGYMYIDLELKTADYGTIYPELLQPKTNIQDNDEHYSTGVYIKNNLITQTGDYPYPLVLKDINRSTDEYVFEEKGDYSILWYHPKASKTVVIARQNNMGLETITLFSYLFGLQILLAIVIMIYRLYINFFSVSHYSLKIINLTLRRRIHLAMLALVFISFLAMGGITIPFFKDRYENFNSNRLQSVMQPIEHSIQEYMKTSNAMGDQSAFDQIAGSQDFKYFITNLSNSQRVDINVFNSYGELSTTSQDNIYNKSLLARIMNPMAYFQLHAVGTSVLVQNESIGKLTYLSSYIPLRNERGETLGFVNIPFFSAQKELDFQISNIIVTLINLYAFLFLISSLIAVFITNSLTRTLNIIIKQFERINLQKNELLTWPYNDEIGRLVTEYNKMVKKVEENASLLAESEREGAWREMARQVAHEIKNPLTPMKLNIQYLQQALKGNHPNIQELANRVIVALIEQIDNLSYIASEFSNFAKMPEAKAAEMDLNELLSKSVELYVNEPDVDVTFTPHTDKVMICADHSQLLRVFTNILQNAVEAIPQERRGSIEVLLKEEGHHVLVSFKDNGSGISDEQKEKMFKPYFTTKTSGTGLGLAMTKKIIEFWKGEIWFDTEIDKGTTFYIRLPLLKKQEE